MTNARAVHARSASICFVTALAVGAVLAIAPSADAANLGAFSADCTFAGSGTTSNVSGSIGDTVTLNVTAGTCNLSLGTPGIASWVGTSPAGANPATANAGSTVTITLAANGTSNFFGQNSGNGITFNFTVSPFTPTSTTPTTPPMADVLQQVGVPISGTCLDLSLPSLNWAGVASGAWGTSWAQWSNGGKGGPVCTRALHYLPSTSSWVIR